MAERDLVRQARDLLAILGAWEFKHRAGLGDRKGVPDVLCCYKGRFVAIECKSPKGRLTEPQERELAAIREAGGVAIVARGLEDVLRGLRQIDATVDQRVRV